MQHGGIFSLDLSRIIGWAAGQPTDNGPRYGRKVLPHIGGEGARYADAADWLEAKMEELRPRWLIVEAALPLQALARYSSERIANQQLTLRGYAYEMGYRYSAEVTQVDAQTVRFEVIGLPRSTSRDEAKRAVMRFCRNHGWRVPDDNAGDAVMLFIWKQQRLTGRPGPLWRAVA